MSFGIFSLGAVMSTVLYLLSNQAGKSNTEQGELRKQKYRRVAHTIFYFSTMEFLQGLQYFVIDDCDNPINKILSFIGFVHISFQPYWINHALNTFHNRPSQVQSFIRTMCFYMGLWFLMRMIPFGDECHPDNDYFCGDQWCSYSGKEHVAWKFKLYRTSYTLPAFSVHHFIWFFPCIVYREYFTWVWMLAFLAISFFVTPNRDEQPAIWCFIFIPSTLLITSYSLIEHFLYTDDSSKTLHKNKYAKALDKEC